ncbi:MAG: putative porin [Candidatus Omnitrophica bacterium]|nr:putative porin [Candidatus Omnitrophota bacterium]
MRKISFVMIVGMLLSLFSSQQLYAGEIDVLVDKLVEKGFLTPVEAQIVLDETKHEVAKEVAKGESYALPKWVQNIKFKGDLRTRYQWEKQKGSEERHRGRIRFRLGSEMKVTEGLKVAAGLATGGTDPRSTNETLDNTFETPDIRLDYAYAQYVPVSWLTLMGGKIKGMPFWTPSDLLWDSDINPDGAAINLYHGLSSNIDGFFNAGLFILDEASSDTSDPFMYVLQPGVDIKLNDDINLKTAVAYYGFDNIKGSTLDHSSGTNSLSGSGLQYNYDSLGVSTELGFKNPLGIEALPYFALIGEYVNNFDPSSDNDGFLVGCAFGDKKVGKKGQWQGKYLYRRLERDAFLDTFPDSDFYGGETNAKGHEAIFQYGLLDNVILGLDYYYSEPIKGVTRNEEHLFQTDIVFKF